MPKSLTTSELMVLHSKDFDPPLKRKKPTVSRWTTFYSEVQITDFNNLKLSDRLNSFSNYVLLSRS